MGNTLTALIILIALSAFFSATETGFSAANRIRLKNMAADGNKRAALALALYEKFDSLLSTILIGNNIVNILSTSLATALFVEYFPENGVVISTVVMTVVVLTFGEIGPKSISKEMPEKMAMLSAPIMRVLCVVATPLNIFFTMLKKLIAKVFNIKGEHSITEDELLTMVEEAKNDGGIDENEGELLKSAIEFYDLNVGDILIPRVEVIAVDIDADKAEIDEIFRSSRFSRLPVYKNTIDNIVGVINQKDFYYTVADGNRSVEEAVKPAAFVLENMQISRLLKMLQQKKTHLAVVTDEYGGTVGIVTLEDVIEELVGEIWDEHDDVIEEFVCIGQDKYKVSCNANLDKMLELFDISAEIEPTTVGGWVMEELERIPEVGDSFVYDTLRLTVTEADERRATEIIAERIDTELAREQK